MDLIEIKSLDDTFKVEQSTDTAYVHANSGGFSMCVSFNHDQCQQLALAFTRAALMIAKHERSTKTMPEAA
jgi:hypothetical protein